MEPTGPSRRASTEPSAGWAPLALRWSCLGLLGLLAAVVALRLGPPDVVPSSAPVDRFSAERARVHLERIARVPHPSGSAAAHDVEVYLAGVLRGLGLEVELQAGPACTEVAGLRHCGNVRNVIATRRGRLRDGALLLSAHYDSVSNAPGAGDDGAAVAALLEAARAVSHDRAPERDVIFAFVDGEEDLLLGANQLCPAAQLRSRVRLVGNFDARGSRGAVTLISATSGSARTIAELSRELSHPVLSSFYPSVARVLPNATDAEVYERCGLETLSFAFAGGFEHYHQGTDSPANLDEHSLQHHGEHALALLRRFAAGALDAREPDADGLVFFDIGALVVVRYPYTLARLFAGLLAAAGVVVLRRRLRASGVSVGALVLAAAGFALACLAAGAVGALLVSLLTDGWRPWAPYVHAAELAGCAACFVVAAVVPLAAWLRRRFSAELLVLGPLLVWMALALATAALLPGMSQLFTWPAAALLGVLVIGERRAASAIVARALALAAAVLMFTPVIYTLLVVLGAPGVGAACACLLAVTAASTEPLALLTRRPRLTAATLLSLGGLGGVALALHVRAAPGPPTPNAVAYALHPPTGQAYWLSFGGRPDAFERQFVGANPSLGSVPAFGQRLLPLRAAPALALEAPTLELLSDRSSGGERTLELRVRSPRAARSVLLWENAGVQFTSYRFDGAAPLPVVRFSPELDRKLLTLLTGLGDRERWSLTMFSPRAEGSILTLVTRHAGALELECADRSEGLALLPPGFAPRSDEWTEGYPGDHTLVSGARLRVPAPEARP